ncbi:MAG: nuclear transport factor 2 family protein [Thermodesulfobacteriota bacterium]
MSERDEILRANDSFYNALGTRDLKAMKDVWLTDERAGCVHPGWAIMRNWETIMQSWESLFDPQDQVDIKLSDVSLEINGDMAWVTCIQEMVYIKREPVTFNISQSTNIFRREGGRWVMLIHHASPVIVSNYRPEVANLQ